MSRLLWLCCTLLLLSGCAMQSHGPLGADERQRAAKANAEIAAHHLRNGSLPAALEKVERALSQAPDLAEAHLVAAELHDRLNQPERAEHHYQTALEIDSDSGAALNNYAGFLCRQSSTDRALDLYRLAARDPLYAGRWMALSNAGRCLADAGRWAAAERYWREVLAEHPDYAPALLGMTEAKLRDNKIDAANQWFSRYTAVSRRTPAMLWLGVRVARAADDGEREARWAQQLRAQYPASKQAAQLTE